jgi:hypothetical protein
MPSNLLKPLLLLILSSIGYNSLSQNWKLFDTEESVMYKFGSRRGNVTNFIPVQFDDSINQVEDTLTFSNSQLFAIKKLDPDIFGAQEKYRPNICGSKYSIVNDSLHILYSHTAEPITFIPSFPVDSLWVFAVIESDTIWAKNSAKEKSEFLGVEDSIMKINFQTSSENSRFFYLEKAILSKNYGLIQMADFYNFGDDFVNDKFVVVGFEKNNIGMQNPTWKDMYNQSIGDEIHIRNYYKHQGEIEQGSKVSKREDLQMKKVVDFVTIDSITSEIEYEVIRYFISKDTQYLDTFNTTLQVKYTDMNVSDTWLYMNNNDLVLRYDVLAYSESSDGGCSNERYIFTVGGVFKDCFSGGSTSAYTEFGTSLIYYSIDGNTFGTPYSFPTNVGIVEKALKANIYPNPSNGNLTVSLDNNVIESVDLIDLTGKVVLHKQSENIAEINLAGIDNGIYFIRIEADKSQFIISKIVVRK